MNRSVVFIEDTSSLELQMRRKSGRDVGVIHYVEILGEFLVFFAHYPLFSFGSHLFRSFRVSMRSGR